MGGEVGIARQRSLGKLTVRERIDVLLDPRSFPEFGCRRCTVVPVVSAVLGSVAGLPAVHAVLGPFNGMTRKNGQVFPGGPPVVKAALGQDVTKEELGGPEIHVRESGTVDNLAEDED